MSFDDWLSRQAVNERGYVGFLDSLKSDKFFKYFNFRLKFLYFRTFISFLIHLVEFVVLFYVFSLFVAGFVFLFRLILYLFDSFWWGALENFREKCRDFYEVQSFNKIQSLFYSYLLFSFGLFFVILFTALAYVFFNVGSSGVFNVYHFYVLAIAFYSSLDVVFKVFHAVVYSISRIFRPLSAIVLVQVSSFFSILFLYPFIGLWAVPWGLIFAAIVKFFVGVSYTWRRYESLSFHKINIFRIWHNRSVFSFKDVLIPGIASSLLRIDLIFTLVLIFSYFTFNFSVLILIVYLISPLFKFLSVWPNLFYFDFVKLRRNGLDAVFHFIKFKLWFYGFLLAFVTFIISVGVVYFLSGFDDVGLLFALFLFLISLHCWGLFQTYLFSFKLFKQSIFWSFVALFIWGFSYFLFGFAVSIIFLSLFFWICFFYFLNFKINHVDKSSFTLSLPQIVSSNGKKWLVSVNDESKLNFNRLVFGIDKSEFSNICKLDNNNFIFVSDLSKDELIIRFAGMISFIDRLSKSKLLNFLKSRYGFKKGFSLKNEFSRFDVKSFSGYEIIKEIGPSNISWLKKYSTTPCLLKVNNKLFFAYCPKGVVLEVYSVPGKYGARAKKLMNACYYKSILDSF
ncbi:MAG: hypothetical protein ACMXX7_00590 [Candidatus Woesearchaeota archaeon]